MPPQSTIICIDNSEFARNGDFIPNRLRAQLETANQIVQRQMQENPLNEVALLTMAGSRPTVLMPLCHQQVTLEKKLYSIQLGGTSDPWTTLRIAQLVFKYRQNAGQAQRVVIFIASPLPQNSHLKMANLGQSFKKAGVNLDLIVLGEGEQVSSNCTILKPILDSLGEKGKMVHAPSEKDANLMNAFARQNYSTLTGPLLADEDEDADIRLAIELSLLKENSSNPSELVPTVKAIPVKAATVESTSQSKEVSKSMFFTDTEMSLRKIRLSSHYKTIKAKTFEKSKKQIKMDSSVTKWKGVPKEAAKSVQNQSAQSAPKSFALKTIKTTAAVTPTLSANSSRASLSMTDSTPSSGSMRAKNDNAILLKTASILTKQLIGNLQAQKSGKSKLYAKSSLNDILGKRVKEQSKALKLSITPKSSIKDSSKSQKKQLMKSKVNVGKISSKINSMKCKNGSKLSMSSSTGSPGAIVTDMKRSVVVGGKNSNQIEDMISSKFKALSGKNQGKVHGPGKSLDSSSSTLSIRSDRSQSSASNMQQLNKQQAMVKTVMLKLKASKTEKTDADQSKNEKQM